MFVEFFIKIKSKNKDVYQGQVEKKFLILYSLFFPLPVLLSYTLHVELYMFKLKCF